MFRLTQYQKTITASQSIVDSIRCKKFKSQILVMSGKIGGKFAGLNLNLGALKPGAKPDLKALKGMFCLFYV